MNTLVPVPWQPECLLTPETLSYLQRASTIAGFNLEIDGADGAYRSYARQKYLYDGYVNGLPGFNTASNPDTGQRNHMRGDAFDLVRTDSRVQAACVAVGLIRDPQEPWHWNNPHGNPWGNDPIIPDTTTADVTSTPIGILMALTDDEQTELLADIRQIKTIIAQPVKRPIGGKLTDVTQIQDNADTNTMVRNLVAQVGSLQQAVIGLAGATGADPAAILAAAKQGAAEALAQLTITVNTPKGN